MDIFLTTAFAFMACDGEIVKEEINLIKDLANEGMFETNDVDEQLGILVDRLNTDGIEFLQQYLNGVEDAQLDRDDSLRLLRIAVSTIYADHDVKYSEIRFFRALRKRLTAIDDDTIIAEIDKVDEFWLKSDVNPEDINFIEDDYFNNINLPRFNLDVIE